MSEPLLGDSDFWFMGDEPKEIFHICHPTRSDASSTNENLTRSLASSDDSFSPYQEYDEYEYYDTYMEKWDVPLATSNMPTCRENFMGTFSVLSKDTGADLSESPEPESASQYNPNPNEMSMKVEKKPSSSESPFECPIQGCKRQYRRKGDLKYHIVNKHPEQSYVAYQLSLPKSYKEGKAYPCREPNCNCGFRWARDLRRHLKAKHAEAYATLLKNKDKAKQSAERKIVWTTVNFTQY